MDKMLSAFSSDGDADRDIIKQQMRDENWRNLRFFSSIAVIAFIFMLGASLFVPGIEENVILYICYGIISLIFYGVSYIKINNTSVKEAIVYSFFAAFLSFGIVMGTVVSPDELTINYIVLMIAIPLLFNTRVFIVNGLTLLSMVIYLIIAYFTQESSVFVRNLLNVIVYGAASMIIASLILRNKFQKLMYQHRAEKLEVYRKESRNHELFINDMIRYASSEADPGKVIDHLVQYIGESLDSDRAYIFEENDKGSFDNTYEWCREGVSRQKENLQNVPYEGLIDVWYSQYERSNNIVISDLEEYKNVSRAVYDILKPQDVNTLVTGPIKINGKTIGFYGVDNPPKELLNDISTLIKMMEFIVSFMIRLRNNAENMEYNALHDQLTNCKNRKALEWLYSEELDRSRSLAVAMCDLNGLKEVNDNQGHDAGDRFILRTADIMRSVFGDDKIYRMGGDEFIAVLTGVTEEEFRSKVGSLEIQLGDTASIGTAYTERVDTDFDAFLKIADEEMYKRKSEYYSASGRNRRRR